MPNDQLRQWNVLPPASKELIDRFPELHPAVVTVLAHRGFSTREEVDRFLQPDYVHHLHDPYLFRDMRKAVERLLAARASGEKVTVHGDYDADGVCGSVVLVSTLKELGLNVDVYLPHRETEGYGLNMNTVKKLAEQGVKVIVTVDCGISNASEVTLARDLGIDVIVTDHHAQPPQLPTAAFAVINPSLLDETYPFRKLAGVGVAFKLCQALFRELEKLEPPPVGKNYEAFEKWLLDIVAISTVTDMVPLVDENRVLVKYGLVVMQKTRRAGLKALFGQIGRPVLGSDARTLGFAVGPRINAAGRLQHASAAYNLLMSQTDAEALDMAVSIETTNSDRQKLTERILKEAMATVGEVTEEQFCVVVTGEGWSAGVMGLVAGKIADRTQRPTAVLACVDGKWVGSGRSRPGFNLIETLQAIAAEDPKVFVKYGGHPQACGFTLPDLDAVNRFRELLNGKAKLTLQGQDLVKTIDVEAEISLSQINWEFFTALQQLPPYGQGNPPPVFASRGVTVIEATKIGKDENHLRLKLEQNGTVRKAICFKYGAEEAPQSGTQVDLLYEVDVNEWNGNRELQLRVVDLQV
ncbi:MAG: single-stranded-DNA-specific exonuclease RecJ [Patescibacteria group bacterium]